MQEPRTSLGMPIREWRMTPFPSPHRREVLPVMLGPPPCIVRGNLGEERCGMTGPCKRAHLKMETLQLSQEAASKL
jgi:hypothetical protein